MTNSVPRSLLFVSIFLFAIAAEAENWPWWRGPRGDGTSIETNVPVSWNATNNIAWKTELPGAGHASPIVWEDRIFTITAALEDEARLLLALDRTTGNILWKKTVLTAPLEKKHNLNSFASSTPATDGQLVYVAFLDRQQMLVAAYDFKGNERWRVQPGAFRSMHGFCSSPVLYQQTVIVNGDHDGDSYIAALDRTTGETIWKTPRLHRTRSYCVPFIREMAGQIQMVLSGDKCVTSYDPGTGRLRWIIDGPTEQFVASPVYSEQTGYVYVTGGFPEHHIIAINPNGSGDVTRTHVVWHTVKGAAYVPSPIIAGDYFLVVSDSGVAHCFKSKTGELLWQERLGEHHASLTSAAGLVYFLSDEGVMNVIKPGPKFERIARNEMHERFFASPAISHGQIYLRGDKHLFAVGRSR